MRRDERRAGSGFGRRSAERGGIGRLSFLGSGAALIGCLLAMSVARGAPSYACDQPPGQDVYKVEHERFGEIGRHVVTFSCQGDDLVVETAIDGEATMLSVPVYALQGRYREVWRGDRLISFDSHVDDNGELFEVSARAEGDHTRIDRRRGTIEAPASIVSDHPWNHAVIDRTLLFDARRGKLRHVEIAPEGEETLVIGGTEVTADRYIVSGDLERVLWYGKDGAWLQSQLEYSGSKVFVTRRD
jgi:hypothetical protein